MLSKWSAKFIDEAVAERAKAPTKRATRMYAGARYSRLTANWLSTTDSADSELWSSLTNLRNRSRQLVRDNSYAKRAKLIVINNVVGTGIGLQARVENQRGKQIDAVNDDIEAVWEEWSRADNCHTGGKLCFADMERQILGQVFEAGEVLIRKHYTPFGKSKVPLALELVEAERIADDAIVPVIGVSGYYRLGVERDEFGRPLGFWLRKWHPGEVRYAAGDPNQLFRVPADQAFHLYLVDRWPQTRGEPWLHAAMRRLNDMDGYAEAEITAARAAACYMGIITTPDEQGFADEPRVAGEQPQFELEPGAVPRLSPGEEFDFVSPNRPNAGMDPFMRLMLREVAVGAMVTYETISGDHSQSNFSASRMGLIDARDAWRAIQQWFIRSFRAEFHREWLQAAVLSRAIKAINVAEYAANPRKFEAAAFKPRGWTYIEPLVDIKAAKEAIRGGLTSATQVVAEFGSGRDIWDVLKERKREMDMIKELGLVFDTDPAAILEPGEKIVGAQPNSEPAAAEPKANAAPNGEAAYSARLGEIASSQRDLANAVANIKAPVINISPQPVVVNTPEVKVDIAPPVVNVSSPPVVVNTPDVNVNIAPAQISLEMPQRSEVDSAEVLERDDNRLARVIRTNRGDFEITERDANGDAKRFKRKTA
jgi:lambda family phage portal protein